MRLRHLLTLAASAALAAWVGVPSPAGPGSASFGVVAIGLAVIVVAVIVVVATRVAVLRRSEVRSVALVALVVAYVVVVGIRADAARAELDRAPAAERVQGVAWIVSDPVDGDLGVRTVLRLDGRRYWSQVPPEDAASVRNLLVGDRVVVTGRVAAFDGARDSWRWSRHLAGVLRIETIAPGPSAPVWVAGPNAVRRTLVAGASGFDERRRSLYLGLVVGDDRDQSDLDRFRFRASGLGHLLAVSGQNVSLVLASAAPLLWRLPRRLRPLLGAALVVLFVVVTRAEPSVLRASVMAVVVLWATSVGRVAGGVRAVSWSVVVLLGVDPLLVHSVGFVLSVAATLGLAIGSEPIARRLRGPRWWRDLVGASLAAQVATLPVQVSTFGVVPVVSLLANVLAVPAAGVVVVLGATTGIVAGLVHPSLGDLIVAPTGLVVGWIDTVASWCSRVPAAPLDGTRALVVTFAVVLAWWGWRPGWARPVATAVAVVAVGVAVVPVAPAPGRHDLARAAVLQVDPSGRRVVAVAPGASPLDVLDGLWRHGVFSVDEVVGPAGSPAAAAVVEQLGVRSGTPVAGRGGG